MPPCDEEVTVIRKALELGLGHTQPHQQILNCDDLCWIGVLMFISISLQDVFLGNVY
jgi:hypothetical protein